MLPIMLCDVVCPHLPRQDVWSLTTRDFVLRVSNSTFATEDNCLLITCEFDLERGEISPNAAGIATAILCQASQLEPNSNAPIVALETGKKCVKCFDHRRLSRASVTNCFFCYRTCLIHKHGITGVVHKEVQKPGAR